MPVSRRTTENLAAEVAEAYAAAEVRLLQLIARRLAAGADSPRWAENKLSELQLFRRQAAREVATARTGAVGALADALERAYLRGAAAGQGDLDDLGVETDKAPPQAKPAVVALVRAQTAALESMDLPIVRQMEDVYRRAVVEAVPGTLTGATTRLQDAQRVLDDLARKGVSGFTDVSGRNWGLQSYVEMATRTTTAQAAVAGHLDRLDQAGIPLVIVSDSSRECGVCRPWEGKVLSRGPVAALMPNALTGEMESVSVDGTVDEATGAGLFHPNCTHNLSAYIHGATKLGDAKSSPEGYREKEQQRHMERKIREWQRREAVAVTPEAKRKAQAKVREWKSSVKAHTEATGLPRKTNRETINPAVAR